MPSDRYRRSRSRSRGRYSDRKRRSRSRSLRRNRRSRSPRRSPRRRRSVTPQQSRRRSKSPLRERQRSRTPVKDRRLSSSPRADRRRSSPQKTHQASRSPEASRSIGNSYRRKKSPHLSPSAVKASSSRLSVSKDRRSSRYSRSASHSPDDDRADKRGRHMSSDSIPSHSPTTLDDVLMREKPLGKSKPTLSSRYDKFDINVISIHNKGKGRRSSQDIDNDGSADDFFPTDVIELVHELNPNISSQKRHKNIFDRDEIKNYVEEKVETKVIRLMPSADEIKKLEEKLSKSETSRSRDSKYKDGRSRRERGSRDSKETLKREPERNRYQVTDDDLLDEPAAATSRLASERDSKRSIQDRLGSSVTSDRAGRSGRRIDDRLGHIPERSTRDVDRVGSSDLRHSLSSRGNRDVESRQAPIVRDYGHKSLSSRVNRSSRERESTPDFSKRPDKGKVDMMELDPTYVPRGGLYDEHDDRTEDKRDWRDRGDWRDRSNWRGRGYVRGRGRGYGGRDSYNRNSYSYGNSDVRDRRSGGSRIVDHRSNRPRKPVVSESWKHDKFAELEEDVKVEPTSTTA